MTDEERRLNLRRRQLQSRQTQAQQGSAPTDGSGISQAIRQTSPTAMDYVEQAGAGSQEGAAAMLGFPVDAVTSAINGVGDISGLYGPIENPIGGSQWIDESTGMKALRQNVPEPSTTGLKASRRVGEELGASAAGFPIALANSAVRAAPTTAGVVEGVSALGSGGASALAQNYAPDSPIIDVVAALLGGVGGGKLAASATGLNGADAVMRSGIDEKRAIADGAYARVRADQTVLPQSLADDISNRLNARMSQERLNPRLHPSAQNVLDAITDDAASGKMSRVEDYEVARRLTEGSIPATAAPDEKRLAAIMKSEITDYIDSVGGDAADDLKVGRDAHRRRVAAESIEEARTKAARQAARTGSGGNEINASRQKLSSIIESQRKSRSFSKEELEAIDQVVQGTRGQNAARRLSRFAPSSGGLSAMLGVGGAMASPAIAAPIMIATEIAKASGERMTKSSIDKIVQSLAPDRVLSTQKEGVMPVVKALLAARTTAGATQDGKRTKQ